MVQLTRTVNVCCVKKKIILPFSVQFSLETFFLMINIECGAFKVCMNQLHNCDTSENRKKSFLSRRYPCQRAQTLTRSDMIWHLYAHALLKIRQQYRVRWCTSRQKHLTLIREQGFTQVCTWSVPHSYPVVIKIGINPQVLATPHEMFSFLENPQLFFKSCCTFDWHIWCHILELFCLISITLDGGNVTVQRF